MSTKQDLKAGSPTVAVGGGVAPRRRSSSKMAGHDNPLQASPVKEDEKGGKAYTFRSEATAHFRAIDEEEFLGLLKSIEAKGYVSAVHVLDIPSRANRCFLVARSGDF